MSPEDKSLAMALLSEGLPATEVAKKLLVRVGEVRRATGVYPAGRWSHDESLYFLSLFEQGGRDVATMRAAMAEQFGRDFSVEPVRWRLRRLLPKKKKIKEARGAYREHRLPFSRLVRDNPHKPLAWLTRFYAKAHSVSLPVKITASWIGYGCAKKSAKK